MKNIAMVTTMERTATSGERTWFRRLGVPLTLLAGGFAPGYAVKSEIDQQRAALHATVEGTGKRVEKIEGTPIELQAQLRSLTAEKKVAPNEEPILLLDGGRPGQIGDLFTDFGRFDRKYNEHVDQVRKEVIPEELLVSGAGNEIPNLAPEDLITTLLKHNPGVFLGDSHGSFNIPEFLIANMNKFSKADVKVIFLEMIKTDADGKKALERLRNTGDVKAFGEYLEKKRWGKENGWTEKIGAMVKKAYDEGIDVVGIDIEHTGHSRLETSNPHWKGVIVDYVSRKEFPKQGKYLVFGGAGHSAEYPLNKGIDYMLGILSADFRSAKAGTPHVRVGNRKDNDFEIVLPKSKDQPPSIFDRD